MSNDPISSVQDCLSKLTTKGSPRQIGDYLNSRGIALECASDNWGGNCPVARCITIETGQSVSVNKLWVWLDNVGKNIRLPSPLPSFVAAFDRATGGRRGYVIDPMDLPSTAPRHRKGRS